MALVQTEFFSTSLMRTVPLCAVIPADRAAISGRGQAVALSPAEQRPFKTLYLMHGIYGSHMDWVTHTRLQALAEERNLAVIMPAGENSFYNDRGPGARYGEFISRELVEFTRKLFRLSDAREDTFIGGLSMGGYGAIVNALRHPETFGAVVALSAGLSLERETRKDVSYDAPGILENRAYLESVFGPLDQVRGSENDYDALAERVAASGSVRPRFFMACGAQDFLLEPNRAYSEHLRKLGFEVDYREGVGTHTWPFWDTWIERALDWLPLDDAFAPVSSGNVK